jgi:glycylpeptide N-tetradecanoyltransferase
MESKEVKSPEEDGKTPTDTLEDAQEEEDSDKTLVTAETSPKSKKKKKKSKLKSLLARKANEEIPLAEVEEALSSTTLDEKKSLSKEDQMKLEMIIKKMNEMLPGGRKDIADHKFWKTQPVIRFGRVDWRM